MCILLADDHALFRSGMKHVLSELDGDVRVVEGASYADAIKIAEQNSELSIILVDLSMPGFDNFIGLRHLCCSAGKVPVVVISALSRSFEISQAMACGISGYIPKTLESLIVLNALKLVLSGEVYLPPVLSVEKKAKDGIGVNCGKKLKITHGSGMS